MNRWSVIFINDKIHDTMLCDICTVEWLCEGRLSLWNKWTSRPM